jgi:putative Mg2+ transporter-C (MgtC) family protein
MNRAIASMKARVESGVRASKVRESQIRAEVITAGRNNEALEQVAMRLSIEDDVSNLSWTIVESALE